MSVETKPAIASVLGERAKQIAQWGEAHDDAHIDGELALAAAYLADPRTENLDDDEDNDDLGWIVHLRARHRNDRRQQLVIAGALVLAEIERLDRAASRGGE